MAFTSSIESHPQREAIINAINAGHSLRAIAASTQPPVHHTAIQRYKRYMALHASVTAEPPTDSIDKAWAEAKLVRIINAAMGDAPINESGKVKADLNLARATIRDLYEANGWMAPKRTESLVANLHALAPAQLRTVLAQVCSSLPAAMQHELAAASPDVIDVPALPAPDPTP